MKRLAGFLLLLSGCGIVVAAIAMLHAPAARAAFVLSGFVVELMGLFIAGSTYAPARRKKS